MVTPTARREAVDLFRDRYGLSERRACSLAGLARSTRRYRRRRDSDGELRRRLEELAAERVRFGYRRLHVLLVREGHPVNAKRVYRLYREMGLSVRRKRRKQVARANRQLRLVPAKADEQWSLDFMSDSLADGRRFRTLNIVDDATRECLAIEVDSSLLGARVCRVLDREVGERGSYPSRIVLDNGPECTSKALDVWASEHGVELAFIRPGKPIENALVGSFNGRFGDECFKTSASTSTGSPPWPTPAAGSRLGGSTTTTSGRTARWATCCLRPTPGGVGLRSTPSTSAPQLQQTLHVNSREELPC